MVVIGGPLADLQRVFGQVEGVARTQCDFCMPYERDRPVFVGRGWKVSLQAIWPAQKMFI